MEGHGSRLGRASSRYGPTATTVFNGPVRKWKKKWVHVAQSQPSTVRYDHTAQSNAQNSLLLRRWTPTTLAADDAGAPTEEPPRRKFRYTPIAVIEEQRKEVEKKAKDEPKPSKTDRFPISQVTAGDDAEENYSNMDDDNNDDEDDNDNNDLNKETPVTKKNETGGWSRDLDLELHLKGSDNNNDNNNVVGDDIEDENEEVRTQIASV